MTEKPANPPSNSFPSALGITADILTAMREVVADPTSTLAAVENLYELFRGFAREAGADEDAAQYIAQLALTGEAVQTSYHGWAVQTRQRPYPGQEAVLAWETMLLAEDEGDAEQEAAKLDTPDTETRVVPGVAMLVVTATVEDVMTAGDGRRTWHVEVTQ